MRKSLEHCSHFLLLFLVLSHHHLQTVLSLLQFLLDSGDLRVFLFLVDLDLLHQLRFDVFLLPQVSLEDILAVSELRNEVLPLLDLHFVRVLLLLDLLHLFLHVADDLLLLLQLALQFLRCIMRFLRLRPRLFQFVLVLDQLGGELFVLGFEPFAFLDLLRQLLLVVVLVLVLVAGQAGDLVISLADALLEGTHGDVLVVQHPVLRLQQLLHLLALRPQVFQFSSHGVLIVSVLVFDLGELSLAVLQHLLVVLQLLHCFVVLLRLLVQEIAQLLRLLLELLLLVL